MANFEKARIVKPENIYGPDTISMENFEKARIVKPKNIYGPDTISMENFEKAQIVKPENIYDPDTIPDSYSITTERPEPPTSPSPAAFLRGRGGSPEAEDDGSPVLESPSDWRLDYRTTGDLRRPHRHWACPFFYMPFLFAYANLGAWMFTKIEGHDQPEDGSNRTECDALLQQFSDMMLDGLPYAVSVFTTVGYGVQAPKTVAGQIATIFYALLGIPIYFAFTYDCQDWVDRVIFVWIYKLYQRLKSKLTKSEVPQTLPKIARWKKFLWMLGISISWLFIQGLITMLVESSGKCGGRWTYMNSIYFVFQSAALIGFGDLMTQRNLYLTVHLPMLIIGQVLLAGLFAASIKYIRYKVPRWSHKFGVLVRDWVLQKYGRRKKDGRKKGKDEKKKATDGRFPKKSIGCGVVHRSSMQSYTRKTVRV